MKRHMGYVLFIISLFGIMNMHAGYPLQVASEAAAMIAKGYSGGNNTMISFMDINGSEKFFSTFLVNKTDTNAITVTCSAANQVAISGQAVHSGLPLQGSNQTITGLSASKPGYMFVQVGTNKFVVPLYNLWPFHPNNQVTFSIIFDGDEP